MGLFSFIEIFFFISLGITIILIAMLVYHFKQRVSSLEQKYESLFDIVSNVVKQLRNIQALTLTSDDKLFSSVQERPPIVAIPELGTSTSRSSGIGSFSEEQRSERPQEFRGMKVFPQSDPSVYLGNSLFSTPVVDGLPQSQPNIFHKLVDPSTEPSRFIIDYDTQLIPEIPHIRDTVIVEDESDSESEDDSESENESESDDESDSDSSYINMGRNEMDVLHENKIVVSDDDDIECIQNSVPENYDIKIITLPTISDNTTSDVLAIHEFEPVAIPELEPTAELSTVVNPDSAPSNSIKDLYKKMTLPNLKATVISKGLCSDPSKMKKTDLLKLLEDE